MERGKGETQPPSEEAVRDVVIIGAGPAGTSAANLLAHDGHDVLVLDKDEFPRFHIGESLLPCDLPVFERLGVEIDPARYLRKAGATFLDESATEEATFHFADGLPGTRDHAWQVERARFDRELADAAAARGAELRFGVHVREVEWSADHVEVRLGDGERIPARHVIDATGQHALLARRMRTMVPIRGFGVVADFAHFHDLTEEARDELEREGNILIFLRDQGWAWGIPLGDGRLSVGFVSREKVSGSPAERFAACVESSPRLRRLTAGASQSAPERIGNYAFLNRAAYGARYACLGDAAAFLDPVFSSGVSLAMVAAESLADILGPALREGREDDPELLGDHKARLEYAYEAFGTLIRSFYQHGLARNLLLHQDPDPEMLGGLVSMLAGDVWREDNLFQEILLASQRRRWRVSDVIAASSRSTSEVRVS